MSAMVPDAAKVVIWAPFYINYPMQSHYKLYRQTDTEFDRQNEQHNQMSSDFDPNILCNKPRKNWRRYENATKISRLSFNDTAFDNARK